MNVAQLLCAGRYAGAEAVACSLADALRPHVRRSLLYLVLETRAGEQSCAELLARVRGLDVETRVFETDRRVSWSLLRALQRAFREDEIDIAHSHSYKTAFMAPLIRRMAPSSVGGIAFTLHGIDLPPSAGLVFLGAINTVGALGSDALIACSQPIARHYRRFPLLRRKTRCLLNGLRPGFIPDLAQVRALRSARRARVAQTFGLDPRAVWIAIVGRLVQVKNHELLFRALARSAADDRGSTPVNLLVAGDGPLRETLAARAREYGLSQSVVFAGQVSQMDELYGAVDLLALASTSEGTPMVVLEAMAYGLPIVATDVGGIADQVEDGTTALLVPSDDEAALGVALTRLRGDSAQRVEMGEAGHRRAVARFGPDDWARRHVEIYREIQGKGVVELDE